MKQILQNGMYRWFSWSVLYYEFIYRDMNLKYKDLNSSTAANICEEMVLSKKETFNNMYFQTKLTSILWGTLSQIPFVVSWQLFAEIKSPCNNDWIYFSDMYSTEKGCLNEWIA